MQQNPDFSQLMKLAQSDTGQQLLRLLRQNGGGTLDDALSRASTGDYTQAKLLLGTLLSDPEAKRLLKQLEEGL